MEKRIVNVYTEATPNPASMKFVINHFLLDEGSVEYTSVDQTGNSPLAKQLFMFSDITGVFISSNFITLTKKGNTDWFEINSILREFIRNYLSNGEPVFTGPSAQVAD